MNDEEFDRLCDELREMCNAAMASRAREILEGIEQADPLVIGDRECILLGFEGNVDVVWAVPDPRPDVLCRAITTPLHKLMDADETVPSYRKAEYQRVGEFTYRRIR